MAPLYRLPAGVLRPTQAWLCRLLPSIAHGQALCEDREGLLDRDKGTAINLSSEPWRAFQNIRLRRYLVFIGIASLLSLLLAIASHKNSSSQSRHPVRRHAQHLHLLIPTPDLHPELCKTILSAEILHYPPPTLIPWDAVPDDPKANLQQRVTSVRNYLSELLVHHANDTAILVDDARVWFQLRPEVLLKRYYEINQRANRRLQAKFGEDAVRRHGIQQTVVFAASSTCGAASSAAGLGSMCEDASTSSASGENGLRYLGHGFAMGPVRDLHEVYRRVVAKVEGSPKFETGLAAMSAVYGDQERQRSLLREGRKSRLEAFWVSFADGSALGPVESNNATSHNNRGPDDFGLGLDHLGELSIDASNHPDHTTWPQHHHLPPDIASSMPPFWTIGSHSLPTSKTWSDLPLLTNAHTHSIPAAITHNTSSSKTASDVLGADWKRLWTHPYARKLFDAYMAVPAMPLAAVVDGGNVEQVFWSTTIGEKAGAMDGRGTWYGWKEICGGDQKLAEEVFGDGGGEWRSPMP